jgi:hypothetical protein
LARVLLFRVPTMGSRLRSDEMNANPGDVIMPSSTSGRSLRAVAAGLALTGILTATVACDSTTGPSAGDAQFQILLTGASSASGSALLAGALLEPAAGATFDETLESPAQFHQVSMAEVWISQVYLVGGGHGRVDLFVAEDEGDLFYMDLMQLGENDEIELTDAVSVPEGRYGQLRVEVDSAHVTLAGDMTFADGSGDRPAMVPSGFLRINLNGDLQLEGGEESVLLADFDLSRSFVFQGPPTAPLDVLMTPVLFQEVGMENEPEE